MASTRRRRPFLEILTRCYKRPVMLSCNQASITGQTSTDWIQTLLADAADVGGLAGVIESHRRMGRYAENLIGRYIWILDDDDECIRSTLVAELVDIWKEHNPDVIMVRMEHPGGDALPDADHWRGTLFEEGDIGVSAFIVRRELWQKHAHVLIDNARYAGDYDLISAILAETDNVFWHDVVASRVQRRSMGEAE